LNWEFYCERVARAHEIVALSFVSLAFHGTLQILRLHGLTR